MTAHRIAGYGSWSSPITSDFVVAEAIGLADLRVAGGVIYWIEARPTENGRNVLVRRRSDGTNEDVTPAPYNVRTRVHEYGGAAYVIAGDTVFFSNFADQRLYRLDPGGAPRAMPTDGSTRHTSGLSSSARTTAARPPSRSTRSSACRSTSPRARPCSCPVLISTPRRVRARTAR